MNSIRDMLRKIYIAWEKGGFIGTSQKIWKFTYWRVKGRRNQVLFGYALDKKVEIYPVRCKVEIRFLNVSDMREIKENFFPLMRKDLEHDKECFIEFEQTPSKNRECFLALLNRKIVHYSWVAVNIPSHGSVKVGNQAAYIGPCFTAPEYRGLGIYPHVLTVILATLKRDGFKKALIEARKDNIASIRSIEKAGFRRVEKG